MDDVGLKIKAVELRVAGIEDRLAALEEFRARVEGPIPKRGLSLDEAVRVMARAVQLEPLAWPDESRMDLRAVQLERELEGIYMGRRGRQIMGGEPDDVWCKGCGRETASVADGSLCGDCGDAA